MRSEPIAYVAALLFLFSGLPASAQAWCYFFCPPPKVMEGETQELQSSLSELKSNVEKSIASLKDIQNRGIQEVEREAERVRKEIEDLLPLLGDGGEVSSAASDNVEWMSEQKSSMYERTTLSDKMKDTLAREWDTLIEEAKDAQSRIEDTRRRLSDLLNQYRKTEGFLEELVKLQYASEANEVINNLIDTLESAIEEIETFEIYEAPGVPIS